jgi:hypothetical protein
VAMKDMYAGILKARNDLEHHSIEGMIGGVHAGVVGNVTVGGGGSAGSSAASTGALRRY